MVALNRDPLQRVVAVINGKGGVLKTTLVANIAGLLAASGYKVLAVDLDPQGNLAEDFGYEADDRNDEGRALVGALQLGDTPQPVRDVRPNLDVLVGGELLSGAAAALAASRDPQKGKLALALALEKIAGEYDLVLLDCPPGEQMLQLNALAAARWVVVPVKTDGSSRKGLTSVAARLTDIRDLNPGLDLLGVIMVGVGTGARRIQRTAREQIAAMFGSEDVLFSATVRHSEATAQVARDRGQLVAEIDEFGQKGPKWFEVRRGEATAADMAPTTAGSVADDLHHVATELISRLSSREEQP